MSGRNHPASQSGSPATLEATVSRKPPPVPNGSGAALVLVGHGSHRSPDSSRPVHELARRLRNAGGFAEVRVAFWKEEPSLRHAFDLVESPEVFTVPVFTSEGYFTDHVVPRELKIDGPVTERQGRRIHYLPPVGTHPRIVEVVLDRARETAPLSVEEASAAALVVVGHGTERHPRSAETTFAVVRRLREDSPYGRVEAAFLDQDPEVGDLLSGLSAPDTIVVPFFISEGWHAGTTIPRDLALAGGRTRRGDRTVWYTLPVGTHRAMVGVIHDLVSGAAAAAGPPPVGAVTTPARAAKQAFLSWLREPEASTREFLQVRIVRAEDGRFELRHAVDRDRPTGELLTLGEPDDAAGVAGVTEDGRHRPLRSAPDLRPGWRFDGLTAEQVWEVFAQLYPAAPVHQHLAGMGELRTTSFQEAAGRQSGMYQGVDALPDASVARLVARHCASDRCLRSPLWHVSGESGRGGAGVPCPEPCSLFIASARAELDAGT